MAKNGNGRTGRNSWAYWLLILPYIATLWVSSYNSAEPRLAGVPFFYWYQFLWIVLGAVITAFVYFATEPEQ